MRRRTNTAAGVILLAVYWYFVIQLTGGTPTNFIIIRDFARTINLSLIPFHDIAEVLTTNDVVGSVIQIVGNLVMFVPLGVLVPLFWSGWRSPSRTIGLGLCMSLFIEINQLFTYRATSVDDLILNTLGAAVGWLCFLLVARLFRVNTRAGTRLEKLPIVILFAVWMCCIALELPTFLAY